MNKKTKLPFILVILLLHLIALSSCTIPHQTFEFTSSGIYFERPSFVDKGKYELALTSKTESGTFHIITDNEKVANDFIVAQITLLSYLEKKGVEVKALDYYVSDYDDTFGDGANSTVHIGLVSTRTYKQVLVTLQTLWGEYTDYGYLYALSNEIAKELKWQVDVIESIDEASMNDFFTGNPDALNLLYPCFSIDYASQETVDKCKALSLSLTEDFKLKKALSKPIEEQVSSFRAKSNEYAQKLQVEFVRNECQFAYNGEFIPLKILTSYAEFLIDDNYQDRTDYLKNIYTDYVSIFESSSIIENELNAAIAKFGLTDKASVVSVHCLSSESAKYIYGKDLINFYLNSNNEITITTLIGYYHEYHHYLSYIINPDLEYTWQSEAFCELGRYYSYYGRLNVEKGFMQQEKWRDLFQNYTGHEYEATRADYYELYDILCYVCDDYELHWNSGRNPINSITKYLIDFYGQDTVSNLFLYPHTVEEVTGKKWDSLIYEWKQHIQTKYKGYEIPTWIPETAK